VRGNLGGAGRVSGEVSDAGRQEVLALIRALGVGWHHLCMYCCQVCACLICTVFVHVPYLVCLPLLQCTTPCTTARSVPVSFALPSCMCPASSASAVVVHSSMYRCQIHASFICTACLHEPYRVCLSYCTAPPHIRVPGHCLFQFSASVNAPYLDIKSMAS
jgi:hypothetical protein